MTIQDYIVMILFNNVPIHWVILSNITWCSGKIISFEIPNSAMYQFYNLEKVTFLNLLFNFFKNLFLTGGLSLYNIGLASALQYSLRQCDPPWLHTGPSLLSLPSASHPPGGQEQRSPPRCPAASRRVCCFGAAVSAAPASPSPSVQSLVCMSASLLLFFSMRWEYLLLWLLQELNEKQVCEISSSMMPHSSLPHIDGATPWNIWKAPVGVAYGACVTASGTTLVLIRVGFFFFWQWILFLKNQELNYWMMRLKVLTDCNGKLWIIEWPRKQLWQKSSREVSKHSVLGIGLDR